MRGVASGKAMQYEHSLTQTNAHMLCKVLGAEFLIFNSGEMVGPLSHSLPVIELRESLSGSRGRANDQ